MWAFIIHMNGNKRTPKIHERALVLRVVNVAS
jgi:hypothetical protein